MKRKGQRVRKNNNSNNNNNKKPIENDTVLNANMITISIGPPIRRLDMYQYCKKKNDQVQHHLIEYNNNYYCTFCFDLLTYSLFASWSSDRDASAISTICLVSDFHRSRSCANDRRYFKSSVDFSDRLSWICDRSLLMTTGRVVVGLPLNLFSVRWKYSCMALLAGISSFLRKICQRRQRLSNM